MVAQVAFADIEILGEENGKTYVLAFYRGYNCYGEKVKCVFSNEELAEFNDIEDDDYNSIDGQNLYLEINNFLPEKIIEEHNNSKNFDWYVYSVGEKDKELKKEIQKDHFLFGKDIYAIAKCDANDDVLYVMQMEGVDMFCIVHWLRQWHFSDCGLRQSF